VCHNDTAGISINKKEAMPEYEDKYYHIEFKEVNSIIFHPFLQIIKDIVHGIKLARLI